MCTIVYRLHSNVVTTEILTRCTKILKIWILFPPLPIAFQVRLKYSVKMVWDLVQPNCWSLKYSNISTLPQDHLSQKNTQLLPCYVIIRTE